MLILPVLQFLGLVKFSIPAFFLLGATLGGFLFGLAMNWGGGCAAGVWYQFGGGSIGAFIAVIGLCLGYIATEAGALKTLRLFIQSVGANRTFDSTSLNSLFDLTISIWKMERCELGFLFCSRHSARRFFGSFPAGQIFVVNFVRREALAIGRWRFCLGSIGLAGGWLHRRPRSRRPPSAFAWQLSLYNFCDFGRVGWCLYAEKILTEKAL